MQDNNTNQGPLAWQLKLIVASNIISAFCITWLIFVPWKTGPKWYLKFSDKLLYGLLITNYLGLPFTNLIVFVYFIFNPNINLVQTSIQPYIVFFNIICIMRVIEFWTVVRRTVFMEMKTFVEVREEQLKLEELQSELLNDDNSETTNKFRQQMITEA